MPDISIPRRAPGARLPPLTAFGMSLFLCLICWTGVYWLARLVIWAAHGIGALL
jgi:hypothetical protein